MSHLTRPWEVQPDHNDDNHNRFKVLDQSGHWFVAGGLDQDDAHLIAAAPDLLEALRRILKYIEIAEDEMTPTDDRWPVDADRKAAQAAIAKATSSSSAR